MMEKGDGIMKQIEAAGIPVFNDKVSGADILKMFQELSDVPVQPRKLIMHATKTGLEMMSDDNFMWYTGGTVKDSDSIEIHMNSEAWEYMQKRRKDLLAAGYKYKSR